MPSQYPTALDTTTTLSTAVNGLQTALTGDHTSGATTITVGSTAGAASAGYATIEAEVVKYTGITSTTLTGCTRGADNTAAAQHSNGVAVKFGLVADHHNALVSGLIAAQTKLGLNTNGASASSIDAGQLAAGSSATITALTGSGLVTGAGLRDSRGAAGANAMVKILPDQILGGAVASITFSAIPATYSHLLIYWQARCSGAVGDDSFSMRFGTGGGGVDSGANYVYGFVQDANTTVTGNALAAATSIIIGTVNGANAPANCASSGTIFIPNYSSTTFNKTATTTAHSQFASGASGMKIGVFGGNWSNTGAITSISLFPAAGSNLIIGSAFSIYGF